MFQFSLRCHKASEDVPGGLVTNNSLLVFVMTALCTGMADTAQPLRRCTESSSSLTTSCFPGQRQRIGNRPAPLRCNARRLITNVTLQIRVRWPVNEPRRADEDILTGRQRPTAECSIDQAEAWPRELLVLPLSM